MEEIKIGEYVRTKNGEIKHFTDKTKRGRSIMLKDVVKHSENIIDLIKINDIAVMNCYGMKIAKLLTKDDILELKLGNYQLISVLTDEQYENYCYRLED